jgi:hypothetical protein
MKKYLPDHILESDKKKVWMTPISQWLREDLKGFASKILFKENEFLNMEEVKKMFYQHVDKKKYNLNLIWALIIFQVWCKNYL